MSDWHEYNPDLVPETEYVLLSFEGGVPTVHNSRIGWATLRDTLPPTDRRKRIIYQNIHIVPPTAANTNPIELDNIGQPPSAGEEGMD